MPRLLLDAELGVVMGLIHNGGRAYATVAKPIEFKRGRVMSYTGSNNDWNLNWSDDYLVHTASVGDYVVIQEVFRDQRAMPPLAKRVQAHFVHFEQYRMLLWPYKDGIMLCFRASKICDSDCLADIRSTYLPTVIVYDYVLRRAKIT